MAKHTNKGLSLVVLFMLAILACQSQTAEEQGLRQFIPQNTRMWVRKDAPLEYVGDNLFVYINGGAEIYEEYGFARVIVQDYTNKNDKTITLELYEMTSPESAFGMYTFKSSLGGREVSIGSQGRLEDYYLNFWKGCFLVTLTGFDADPETLGGLEEIAEKVEIQLGSADLDLFYADILPTERMIKASIKYFKGHLGLFNSYALSQKDVFRFKEGVRADYTDGVSLFIFRYDTREKSHQVFGSTRDILLQNKNHKPVEAEESDFLFYNSQEQLILIRPFQMYILMTKGKTSYTGAQKVLAQVEKNITEIMNK